MRIWTWIPFAISVIMIGACSGTKYSDGPIVEWNKIDYDFGTIEEDVPVTTTFILTNISEKEIQIDNIRTTCGCTSPDWTQRVIEPQDTAHVLVEYDAKDKGEFAKVIKVFLNRQRKGESLFIQGEVK